MTNNKYVPVELPKTETISYFNEVEWNEGLTPEEIAKNDEIAELQYQDNVLNGPKVGPGNSQSSNFGPGGGHSYGYPGGHPKWGPSSSRRSNSGPTNIITERIVGVGESAAFVSKVAFKAAVATSLTVATGGWAPIVGGGMWIGGEWLQSRNDDFLRFVGSHLQDIGGGTFFGGLFGNSTVGEAAKNSGISLKDLEQLFEIKGSAETLWEVGKHGEHKNRGISYDSDCEVCRL